MLMREELDNYLDELMKKMDEKLDEKLDNLRTNMNVRMENLESSVDLLTNEMRTRMQIIERKVQDIDDRLDILESENRRARSIPTQIGIRIAPPIPQFNSISDNDVEFIPIEEYLK